MTGVVTMHSLAINHLALNCQDVAAQEALFAKHFGFQHSRTFNAGKPNEFIVLKLGSVSIGTLPYRFGQNRAPERWRTGYWI
jgi:hypothetical protein